METHGYCPHCEQQWQLDWRLTLVILRREGPVTRSRYGSLFVLMQHPDIRAGILRMEKRKKRRAPKICYGRDLLLGTMATRGAIVIENTPDEQFLSLAQGVEITLTADECIEFEESLQAEKESLQYRQL